MTTESSSNHFGVCPECHQTNGYINIGRAHWFYCAPHQVKWCVGSNLFSDWKEQTEAQQREIYESLRFDNYEEVKEYHGEIQNLDKDHLVHLSDEEIAAAEAKAKSLVDSLTFPEIWAIGALMGWCDGLGGQEYQSATLERLGELCESRGSV